MAAQINKDYIDKNPLFLSILNGAFIFAADLFREITIPAEISFIKLKSYRRMETSGKVKELLGLEHNIFNRNIIIIEDIVDTGQTIHYLIDMLKSRGPASIRTCALLHKEHKTEMDIDIDYLGFTIGDEWVVGYGLDFAEHDRTLPYIGVVKPDS